MHACSSSYTHQQNERLVHARVQFPMVIRHRSVVRTRKMLRAFLKTCRAVQLLHACIIKFKVSGTVYVSLFTIPFFHHHTEQKQPDKHKASLQCSFVYPKVSSTHTVTLL